MKLISLNIWGGHEINALLNFIKSHSNTIDIFCLQEVFDSEKNIFSKEGFKLNILKDLKKILINYHCYFNPCLENYLLNRPVNFKLELGLTIFIKKNIKVLNTKEVFIFQKKNEVTKNDKGETLLPENMQYIKFKSGNKLYTLSHFHGLVFPGNKRDSKDRIKQSKIIKNFLNKQNGKVILCGDFNLIPSTRSLRVLEQGMVNLNKKFDIKRTRSKLNIYGKQRFADYTLVSPEVDVLNFRVLDVEVSDHLPMTLEFS